MPIQCSASISENGFDFATTEDTTGKPYPELTEWPHKWEKPVLTYRLNNLSPDIQKEEHQTRAVTVSFRAWRLRIKDLRFRRERNPDVTVDIDIRFRQQEDFASQGILARAYYPGQGTVSGNIEINDGWDWVSNVHVSDLGHPPLVPILIHEIGHSLGLRHDTGSPDSRESIMYPSFNLGLKKHKLGPRDVERIQWKYGKRSLSDRIIKYFQERRLKGWDFD